MNQSPVYEFLKEEDETPEECVERHLSEVIAETRRKAVALVTQHLGSGNVQFSHLGKIDMAMEQFRTAHRPVMLAQIEAHGQPTQ